MNTTIASEPIIKPIINLTGVTKSFGTTQVLKQITLGAFETSIAYDMLTLRTDDVVEGSTAFIEKRPPNFTGH